MALSKEKKQQIVADVAELFDNAKMTVVAKYAGTSVKSLQTLKRSSRENGTIIKVVKNRLVKKAMEQNAKFAGSDVSGLTGQILYAFNSEDEVAPAQVVANFAKSEPQIEFVGAFTSTGDFLSPDDVRALASLPSKDQLRSQILAVFTAPMSGFVNVMAGNVRGVLGALNARAESLK